MKPNYQSLTVEGHLPQAGRKMTIDPGAMAHILRILIDLYSDRELAVIRELSTNALDSHVMAGVSRPIEISTPSHLSPYFVVEDFGLGLTESEIYELFGGYGASTKRDTNDATGMLGLGSKSPLTYTNTFTMEAVKDGERAVVAITRGEDGVGELNVVDLASTDAANGVKIRIPAKSGHAFEAKCRTFFSYWQPGTVLLNGKDPSGLEDAMEITPSIKLLSSASHAVASMVVMGNVPYPAPQLDASTLGLPYDYRVVAYVPIGSVDFAPSREGLVDTKRTQECLARIITDFRAGLDQAVQREIDRQVTPFAAMKTVKKWKRMYAGKPIPTFTFRHNGKRVDLPTEIKVPTKPVTTPSGYTMHEPLGRLLVMNAHDRYSYGRRGQHASSYPNVTVDLVMDSMFVTDLSASDISVTMRKKATQWLRRQPAPIGQIQSFVLCDFKPDFMQFVPAERQVSWATLMAEKLPKVPRNASSGRIPGSFDLLIGGKKEGRKVQWSDNLIHDQPRGVPGDKIDQKSPVFYIHGNQSNAASRYAPILDLEHDKYTIICLPENRLAKFKRENPKIGTADVECAKVANKIANKFTEDEKKAKWMKHNGSWRTYMAFVGQESKIDDPEIKELIRLSQVSTARLDNATEVLRRTDRTLQIPMTEVKDPLQKRYPLAASIPAHMIAQASEHVVLYMNAVYAEGK